VQRVETGNNKTGDHDPPKAAAAVDFMLKTPVSFFSTNVYKYG